MGDPLGTIERTVEHRKVRFQLFKMAPLEPNDDQYSAKSWKLHWALEDCLYFMNFDRKRVETCFESRIRLICADNSEYSQRTWWN